MHMHRPIYRLHEYMVHTHILYVYNIYACMQAIYIYHNTEFNPVRDLTALYGLIAYMYKNNNYMYNKIYYIILHICSTRV